MDRLDTALESTRQMLKLYRGQLLPEDAAQPWLLAARERLHQKFVRATLNLADFWQSKSDWARAISLLEAGVSLEPIAEDLYRRLMVCHGKSGDQAEAMRSYRRCKDMLSIVLGIKPSAATERLRQDIYSN